MRASSSCSLLEQKRFRAGGQTKLATAAEPACTIAHKAREENMQQPAVLPAQPSCPAVPTVCRAQRRRPMASTGPHAPSLLCLHHGAPLLAAGPCRRWHRAAARAGGPGGDSAMPSSIQVMAACGAHLLDLHHAGLWSRSSACVAALGGGRCRPSALAQPGKHRAEQAGSPAGAGQLLHLPLVLRSRSWPS